jgi:hypothetical protein
MLITMEDIRAGGGCAPGLRAFFSRYGLNIKAFIRDGGIDAELLAGTGDALAIQIVNLARAKQANANGGADGR